MQARSRRFDAFEVTSCSEASLFSSTDTSTCTNFQWCFIMYLYIWYAVQVSILSLKRCLQAWHDPPADWRFFFKALCLPPATNVQMQLAECCQSQRGASQNEKDFIAKLFNLGLLLRQWLLTHRRLFTPNMPHKNHLPRFYARLHNQGGLVLQITCAKRGKFLCNHRLNSRRSKKIVPSACEDHRTRSTLCPFWVSASTA